MGALKAAVDLLPVNTEDKKRMDKIFKLLNKKSPVSFTEDEINSETIRLQDAIDRGMEKYAEEKNKGKVNSQLEKSMYYKND